MIEYKETKHTLQRKAVSDLSLYSAGYEQCVPGHHYGPICCSYQLIHFVLSGKGELEIDGHTFQLGAGDAFIIPSDKITRYAASVTDPWCYTWISFLGINAQMYTYQLIASAPDHYILHGLDVDKYRALIARILELEGAATTRYFKANSLLLEVLAELFDDAQLGKKLDCGRSQVLSGCKLFGKTAIAGRCTHVWRASQLSCTRISREISCDAKTVFAGYEAQKSMLPAAHDRSAHLGDCAIDGI